MSTTRVTRYINAPRAKVYATILDRDALAKWKVPDGMTLIAHTFEPRKGGAIHVSLTYDATNAQGKSAARTDTYRGYFRELVPNERIVEVDEFESDNADLRGEMIATITLTDAGAGTRLEAVHENVPDIIPPGDNEMGWNMSLAKLAALVERG